MRINLKKTVIIVLDLVLATYLAFAMTSFNKPDETSKVCTKVSIDITDGNTNGFLSANEIKKILEQKRLYPLDKRMSAINPRSIEDALKSSPFIQTAECYKTQDGQVCVSVSQRLPVMRVKSALGEDYYMDDNGGIMPNSKYTSDLIIATGNLSRQYARNYIVHLTKTLMQSDLWKNQIEQINLRPDLGIELVPRVGDHIIYIGRLPEVKNKAERPGAVAAFVRKKTERLEKFYKYGLSQAGWNKYSLINLEFDNQIICKKRNQIQKQ